MSVAGRLAVLALRPLAEGGCDAAGQSPGDAAVGPVAEFLTSKLAAGGTPLADALRRAMDRAWKALEIALHGGAWVRQISTNADDRRIAEQLGALTIETEADMARREAQRRLALPELKEARKKNLLNMPSAAMEAVAPGLARGAALYARFDDFEHLLQADRSAVQQIAEELKQAGCTNLAAMIVPDEGMPLLVIAVRYFFQHAIADVPALAAGLAFARHDELLPELQEAFDNLHEVVAEHGRRLEELLGNAAAAVVEPKIPALDLKAEAERAGDAHGEMYRDVLDLMRRFDLTGHTVRAQDSDLVRNENERQQVRRVVERFRALAEGQRQRLPALMHAIGQLELAAGDAAAALREFQGAAALLADPTAKGEAHANAHRAALHGLDYVSALKEFLESVKLDARRFATFPVGKYIPFRVLGSGGFGTAFLCKHKYMNSQVVVKTLSTEGLERDVDEVFTEAQALGAINHPAIIRVQDCGYVEPAKKHRPFLVMDHFEGSTLRAYVESHGPLSVPELLALVEPVAAGLEAAHSKGIVHRDVKPDNLLVKRLPDVGGKPRWDVKLIDFGLSLKQQQERHSSKRAAMSIGTAEYAAPEQLGRLPGVTAGPSSDIFGFGKTCCFALFQSTSPLLKHWKSVPQPLADLLERCLNERPEDRPRDFTIVSRCFARLGAPVAEADIPVVTAIASSARPAAPADHEDDDPRDRYADDYVEPRRGGGGKVVLIVLMMLALLMLIGCGGGAGALYYFWDDINGTTTDTATADNGGSTDPIPPFKIDPNNPIGGGNDNPKPAPNRNREDKNKIVTFVDVPSQEVADMIIDRVRSGEDAWSPKILKAVKNGNDVTVTLEEKFGSRIDDWARNLELGVVSSDGDNFKVAVVAPPAPQKPGPVDVPELPQLSPVQFRAVVAAFQANKDIREAISILKSTSPRDEQRSIIRGLLKLKVKDAFDGKEAVEALGIWGTPEDATFLTSLDGGNPFQIENIIAALRRLREPSSASYLVRKLDDPFNGDRAMDALRDFGPVVEKDVLTALSSTKADVRRRACRILKEIGSTASLPALKNALQDRDRDTAKLAWDAYKTLTFHPSKPYSAEPTKPVASKPKSTSTVDDLKLTELEESAAGIAPNISVTADGQGFYTLEPANNIRRWSWDGKIEASVPARGFNLLAVGSRGVVLSSSADAKILDAMTLAAKQSGPIENAKFLTTWPELDFAILRCDGLIATMPVVDLGSFTIAAIHAEKRIPNAKVNAYVQLPTMAGKTDPVMTPDGKTLFMQGGGVLGRWSITNYKITSVDTTKTIGIGDGKVVVSPDGRYVALFFKDGNTGTPGTTAVYSTADLKKPAFTVTHGPQATAFAFDSKGRIYVSTSAASLIRFDSEGKKIKDHQLPMGSARQIVASSDGTKLLLLSKDKLTRVELP